MKIHWGRSRRVID